MRIKINYKLFLIVRDIIKVNLNAFFFFFLFKFMPSMIIFGK